MRILTYVVLAFFLTAHAGEAPTEETAGIGVALGTEGQYLIVQTILPDSPAAAHKNLGWNKTHNVWVSSKAIKSYHVADIPTAYVIDRYGKIVAANPVDIPERVNREVQHGTEVK
jgi:hypothetical protein